MTLKTGKGAVKAAGAKAVAHGHNVSKGGFQKPKAGSQLQNKALLGKKDMKPLGKVGAPKQQQAMRGSKQPMHSGKNGKASKGKFGDDDDDEDDEDEDDDDEFDDEDMGDDDDEMDDEDDDEDDDDEEDDDEELSDEEPQQKKQKQPPTKQQPAKQAGTPKSILKSSSNTTPKSADDEKVPKLVPIAPEAAKAATKGGQQQTGKQNEKAKKAASDGGDAFKLIANASSEPLTQALRGEFESRVRRISNSTVFVKGLHRRCTEDELRKLVKDVIVIRLPVHEKQGSKAGRSRGYAFLEFKDEATARRNVDFLNKEARLVNAEGQPCKLDAKVSSAGGYVMSPDDWNVGSLYVAGMPNKVTEDDLTALFDRDQVVTVVLPRNHITGAIRSSAHVRFRSAESAIRQFDAARAKITRGEFCIGGHTLAVAFSSRQTLKRERAEQQKLVPADKKAPETPKVSQNTAANASAAKATPAQNQTPKAAANTNVAKVTPAQTPKTAAAQNTSAAKPLAKPTPTAAANKSLNESVTKKQAATPVQTSAQKGAAKRKLEEVARKAKMAKRDEDEDDDEDDDDEDDDDVDDEDDDDDDE